MAALRAAGILWRSLLVQASWNFERMQNLGFFLMVFPTLAARNGRGSPALTEACRRHLRLFNTHPYLAGFVAATVLKEEASGRDEESVDALRRSLTATLGGIGDDLFWGHLRPLAALAALPAALAGIGAAPLVMLAVYNVPHLFLRVWGVAVALRPGPEIPALLRRLPLARAVPLLGAGLAALAGFLVGAFAMHTAWGLLPGRGGVSQAAAGTAFVALIAIQARGVSAGRVMAALTVLALIAGAARVGTAP